MPDAKDKKMNKREKKKGKKKPKSDKPVLIIIKLHDECTLSDSWHIRIVMFVWGFSQLKDKQKRSSKGELKMVKNFSKNFIG